MLDQLYKDNYSRLLFLLIRYFGLKEFEIAEDILQESFEEAHKSWNTVTIPDNPEGWIMNVAKKKMINYLKRKNLYETKVIPENIKINEKINDDEVEEDNTLKMLFAICHPKLAEDYQTILSLKILFGLSVPNISSALLTNNSNVNKKLYRAKQKFRNGEINFEIPEDYVLENRLDMAYKVLYLIFNESYYSSDYDNIINIELSYESVRLLKQLNSKFPNSSKGTALLSLMILSISRYKSRLNSEDEFVLLSNQDRNLWDKELISEGIDLLNKSFRQTTVPNSYILQAGIAAEHCIAKSFEDTDWDKIYKQYLILEKIENNYIVTLNKTIAQFYLGEYEAALQELIKLTNQSKLKNHSHLYITLGVFYAKLKIKDESLKFFKIALRKSKSKKLNNLINQRIKDLN